MKTRGVGLSGCFSNVRPDRRELRIYLISVAISLLTGIVSGMISRKSTAIYDMLSLPPLAPPKLTFPIVWTILFIVMGISAAGVFLANRRERGLALKIYFFQLLLAFLWPIVFFNGEKFFVAFLLLIAQWILVFIMIRQFYAIRPWTAYILIPYILWITFAAYLNIGIIILNT